MKRILFFSTACIFTFFLASPLGLFAAPPAGGYAPGQTLDPNCAPGDADCFVVLTPSPWEVSGSNIFYDTGNVGVGTNSPTDRLTVNGGISNIGSSISSSGFNLFQDADFLGGIYTEDNNFNIGGNGLNTLTFKDAQSFDFIGGSLHLRQGNAFFTNNNTLSPGVYIANGNYSATDGGLYSMNGDERIATLDINSDIYTYTYGNAVLNAVVDTVTGLGRVGIGNSTPDPSSVLDISSNALGLLIPRMTDIERDAISSPATGLLVYNTTDNAFNFYNGVSWTNLSPWATNGPNVLYTMNNVGIGLDNPITQLHIADDSLNPPVIFNFGTISSVSKFDIHNNYLYAVGGSNSLLVIDISNPTNPVLINSTPTGNSPMGVSIKGNYAYIPNQLDNNFQIFDISNPANPTLVSTTSTNLSPYSLIIEGRYVYISSFGSGNLQIFDVSNVLSPILVSTTSVGVNPTYIEIQDKYIYTNVFGNSNMQITDISNPASPINLGSISSLDSVSNLDVRGRYLYTVVQDLVGRGSLKIIDISDPLDPVEISTTSISSQFFIPPKHIKINGNYAYIGYDSKIQIIDISNPLNPVLFTESLNVGAFALDVQGRYLYSIKDETLYITDLGGGYIQNLESGSAKFTDLLVEETLKTQSLNVKNSINVGSGGIFSSGFMAIAPQSSTNQITLSVGSSFVTDGTGVLRLRDTNSICTFNANTGSPTCGSDETLKKNISSIENSLAQVLGLRPTNYNWLTDEDGAEAQHGFIAQEVEAIFPHLVTENTWVDGTTRKFLNTGGMIPYIVGAIKDMYTEFKTNFVTKRIQVEEEICFDDVCLDKEKVLELLNDSNITPSSNYTQDEAIEADESSENNSNPQSQSSSPEGQTQEETPINTEAGDQEQDTNENTVEEILEDQSTIVEEQTIEGTETELIEVIPTQSTTE